MLRRLSFAALAASSLVLVPAAASAATEPRCIVGAHAGVPDAQARIATELVCDEVRKAGVPVVERDDEEGDPSGDIYRVQLQEFGRTTIVRLSLERDGRVLRTERLTVGSIDEITVVAPRLAGAVVDGKPIEETAHVDDLSRGETRKYEKKPGETFWSLGVAGMSIPGQGVAMAPAFGLGFFYEAPEFAVGAQLFGGGTTGNNNDVEASLYSFGIFGRYYFGKADTSAYVGGGLGYSGMSERQSTNVGGVSTSRSAEGSGVGLWGSLGVEFLRLHRVRLALEARLDVPFFSMTGSSYSYSYSPTNGSSTSSSSSSESHWAMPLSVGLTFAL